MLFKMLPSSTNLVANDLQTLLIYAIACLYTVCLAVSSVQSLSVDVTSTPQPATVHEEDSVTIRCVADYVGVDSSINFTWFHDDVVLATGRLVRNRDKYFVTLEGETASILRIADINRDDGGPYTCVAVDIKTEQSARSSVDITVLYPPAAHYPQCFVRNAILQDLTDIPEGTSLTMVCSSDVASPLPTIAWFRSDREPTENRVGGTTVSGNNFVRNEITVIVTKDLQGSIFECKLLSTAFPSFYQTCTLGPISVLSDGPTMSQPRHTPMAPNFSTERLPTKFTTDGNHVGKKRAKYPEPPSTTTVASPCLTTFSFADKAMMPTTVILAILLLMSVFVNILQMAKISQLSSTKSNLVSDRREAMQENSYMAINQETRKPSTYAELNMRSNIEESVGDYYEYDMPEHSKPSYEHMSRNETVSSRSTAAYEDMIHSNRPVSATSQSRPTSQNRPLSLDRSSPANPLSIQSSSHMHTYERSISVMSGQ